MPTNYDVSDVIDNAPQFKSCRLISMILIKKMTAMRNHISSISNCKHTMQIHHLHKLGNDRAYTSYTPTNISPTFVSVNLVGIILLSIQVKKTALGWKQIRNNLLLLEYTLEICSIKFPRIYQSSKEQIILWKCFQDVLKALTKMSFDKNAENILWILRPRVV